MEKASHLPSLPRPRTLAVVIASVFLLTFATYGRSLSNQFVSWNDPSLIYGNEIVRHPSFETVKQAFTRYDPELYIPLTFLSYQVDFLIGGLHRFVYRLDNLLLHSANVLLVMWFVFLLSESEWIALACGLLFAVHPLNTEAVAWTSSRKDLLSTLFFLCSAVSYVYYRETRRLHTYILSITAFLLGLLSKVLIVIFPLVLLLSDYRRHRRWEWRLLIEKAPYFALAAVFAVVGWFGKALQRPAAAWTLSDKALLASKSIVFYLSKLFVPVHLSVLYPYNETIPFFRAEIVLSVFICLSLAAAAWIAWRRVREITFGMLFFLITLAPTFLNIYRGEDIAFAADHYAYLPSVGFFYVVCFTVYWLCRTRLPRWSLRWCSGIGASIVLLFAWMSSVQAHVWHDSEALFLNALRYYPQALTIRMNLTNLYIETKEIDKAIAEVRKLLLLQPRGRTHRLLADIYTEQQQYDQAEAEYRTSIDLDPKNAEEYAGLGYLYMKEEKFDEATAQFERALQLDPAYLDVRLDLAAISLHLKQFTDAEHRAEALLAIDPFHAKGHYVLGLALEKQGRISEAIEQYERVVELDPHFIDALTSLATLQLYRGQGTVALATLKRAFALDPKNPGVQLLAREMIDAGIVQPSAQ